MDPVKVKAITEWPELKSKKEVQQFLDFLNFYQRFIQDFGAVSQPLTKLTGKEPWQWGEDQITAFSKLKELATSQPVLNLFEFGRPTKVETDASTYGMGAVLSQKLDDDTWRLIAFISKAFNPME